MLTLSQEKTLLNGCLICPTCYKQAYDSNSLAAEKFLKSFISNREFKVAVLSLPSEDKPAYIIFELSCKKTHMAILLRRFDLYLIGLKNEHGKWFEVRDLGSVFIDLSNYPSKVLMLLCKVLLT